MQKKVNALIDIKLEKFKSLSEETNFFWWEMSAGTYRFDRIENEVWAFLIHIEPVFISANWIDRLKEIILRLLLSREGKDYWHG